jgi:pimeloyl-ACP methyl ester carboxylesterase
MQPEVRYCTTEDGVRIAYTVTGSGTPLVLYPEPMAAHAQLCWSHPNFGVFLRELARRNTLIMFDPRGTGLSQRVHGQTLDDYVLDIEAVVKRTGLRTFGFVGMQLSTPATIAFASRYPKLVTRLVLIEGFTRFRECFATPHGQALIAAAKVDFVVATEALGFTAFGEGREESRGHGAYIRACIDPSMIKMIDLAAGWDVSEAAASIAAHTLVLKHSGVYYTTMEMAKDVAARIPNGQLTVVEGTWAHDPEGVARRITVFINRDPPAIEERVDRRSPLPRLVTVLFTDLVGHSEMMSRLGDQRGREVLREHERITRDVLKAHGAPR